MVPILVFFLPHFVSLFQSVEIFRERERENEKFPLFFSFPSLLFSLTVKTKQKELKNSLNLAQLNSTQNSNYLNRFFRTLINIFPSS